ncbi:J domain-containing protein [Pseudomonas sp. R2.Fl]|nr:J domain-containing protein [Pseudomonas sp. R2.Fl]
MAPFDLLGVPRDADETTIKRAYARRLKVTRPDDDPEGFQRLHEAYQQALQHCRQRAMAAAWEEEEDDIEAADEATVGDDGQPRAGREHGHGETELLADPATAHTVLLDAEQLDALISGRTPHLPPPVASAAAATASAVADATTRRFDFDGFFAEAMQRARDTPPAALSAWLAAHDDLYQLELKQSVGDALFQRLGYDGVTIPPANLSALETFFGQQDYWLEQRMAVRWAIEREQTSRYDEPRPLAIRQLKRPFRWPQALAVACVPGMSARIARLSQRLREDYGDLPEGIDPGQDRFFRQLARKDYLGVWRWLPMLARAALLALLGYLLAPVVFAQSRPALQTALVVGGGALAIQGGWRLMVWLHAISLGDNGSANESRRALIPVLLAVTGLVLAALSGVDWLAYPLVVPAALIHWRRSFDALRFLLGGIAMQPLLPGTLPDLWSAGAVGFAMVPLGLALFDGLYGRSQRIPLSAAAGNGWTTLASYGFFVGWVLARVV